MPYSTLILTHNESANIRRCLESLEGCDDVVVVDSMSTDDTVAVAESLGARVFSRRFDTFAAQRNWGVDHGEFRHPWVLHLDADECLTPALHDEIEQVIARDDRSAHLIANKLMFMGRWIRHASMYPYYQARLLKRGEAWFGQVGHGQILAHAERGVGTLREPYVHHNFSRGVSDWVERHNRYSTDEARRLCAGQQVQPAAARTAGDATEARQQWRKRLAARLPFRPVLRFLYLYVFRLGCLDGRPGFDYCVLMSFYDYLTRLKAREMAAAARGDDVR
jgi:hypothetical protein